MVASARRRRPAAGRASRAGGFRDHAGSRASAGRAGSWRSRLGPGRRELDLEDSLGAGRRAHNYPRNPALAAFRPGDAGRTFGEPVSLRGLARQAGVHPVHFAAAFRRFHGCSLGEYLRRRRLQYTWTRLADPEVPLAQVAAEAGFADQSHLTQTFKRFIGMTPRRYRTFLLFKTRRAGELESREEAYLMSIVALTAVLALARRKTPRRDGS